VSEKHNVSRRFYGFIYRLFDMKKKTRLIDVDFKRPWWDLIIKQKWAFLTTFLIETVNNVFLTVPALLLESILNAQHYEYFFYFVLIWLSILLCEVVSDYYATRNLVQCIQSIHYYATQLLLKIDPVCHAQSAKGKVIAKIYRGAEAYGMLIRNGSYELYPLFIGSITVVISLLTIDVKLGLLSLVLLSAFSLIFTRLFLFSAKALMPICIEADDRVKSVGTESIFQISLIRSTFTSSEVNTHLKSINQKRLSIEGTFWRCYDIISTLAKISYLVIFATIGAYVIALIKNGSLGYMTGIALLITFFNGTYQLLQIGQFIYRFKDQLERVKDLFSFMSTYGKQTFPSFEDIEKKVPVSDNSPTITIEARTIKFKYNTRFSLFNKQNLFLSVPIDQAKKIYGIIGFSGQGKSTLLSMLGGQLKPNEGSVLVNGKNLYEMNDEQRRQIIAVQHQTSSTMRGTVKYNLLFGLPNKPIYTKNELISLLERVGLWALFSAKRGLDTPLSEGGLSLSSGQRQRLNFASLYLRAKYYHPKLILLDEPTSHLDEVSEKVVVDMITELAQSSVVLMVTHRLRTLEQSVGILDLSIMEKSKNLLFIEPSSLASQSFYYQQLRQGSFSSSSDIVVDVSAIPQASLNMEQNVIET